MPEYQHQPIVHGKGDEALKDILDHIGVPMPVLKEARTRRDLVLKIAMGHDAARDKWNSGSIAHGTHNKPLGDADCGVMVDRRSDEFRAFGPDAADGGLGPEAFIQSFSAIIEPGVRASGYPNAKVDLEGNRAIKIDFNQQVDTDELGPVDPSVDLIVGLERRDGPGIWIPNRREGGWDAADPQKHTTLMTGDPKDIRVARAHLVRLAKRAIKRDSVARDGVPILCSWNVSALALECVAERAPLAEGLTDLFSYAATSIAADLTKDPAGVADPIKLPDGITRDQASQRLHEMAEVIAAADQARTQALARDILARLFGVEIEEIRSAFQKASRNPLNKALGHGDAATAASLLTAPATYKSTRSSGGRAPWS